MNPLVSIIVPCYNQAQYLPETLDSVLAQTYNNWECIIVNDGSPDNTEEIAKVYCDKDQRFKYIYKENGGLSSARNAGLKLIKGSFVQFLDSDDMIDSQKFEKQITSFIQNKNLNISITNYYSFDNNLKIYHTTNIWNNKISSDIRHDILFRWDRDFSIPIHCALFKTELIKNIQFNEQLFSKEDWLFWIEITRDDPRVEYIDEELAFYRFHPESMSQNTNLMEINKIKAYFYIVEKLIPKEKDAFIIATGESIVNDSLNKQALIDEISKVKSSKAYRLGKFILKPFSFIRHKVIKI